MSRAFGAGAALAVAAFATAACGTIIGIPDRELDPGAPEGGQGPADAGGGDAAADAPAAADTSAAAVQLACGSTPTCSVPPAACCGTRTNPNDFPPQYTYACNAAGTCGADQSQIRCARTSDCTVGQICCLEGFPPIAACTRSGCRGLQLCDTQAADPGCGSGRCEGLGGGFPSSYGSCR